MKKLAFSIVWVVIAGLAMAQNAAEAEVASTIRRLFKGMQLGDSAMVHTTFTADVQFATMAAGVGGVLQKRTDLSLGAFLQAVGSPHAEAWNEEIWNLKISVDGSLAQAWCNYAFYIGKKFSHCGVNAFLLHKDSEGWKIFYLADTRRPAPCAIPGEIGNRYN